ncbi:MAG: metallophosphoesterase [Gemmobacter sp.]|uniref:metallophosphoesterase family protein n=1 Tax=Gemmobacter sp. TaxID=1898957 RepID=UPI001A44BA67|nr:metallophosphoesterase [Gemmobacter sp.]MBL8561568.1 metallophosphoesterase [Gemmobacter sp.]
MTRIVHLSDLHFGALAPGLEAPLTARIRALAPDLVVASGDLTQRARAVQFAQARAFLLGLGAPVLAVPGNHDMPLHRPLTRLLRPFRAWDRGWSPDREPVWQDDRVIVVGVNTADPYAWRRGVIRQRQLDRVGALLAQAGPRARVVVMHHPLEHLPGEDQPVMRGAALALAALPHLGAQMVLSGHIHVSHAGPFTAAPGLVFVQAGTGLSHRRRTEANAFNLLDFSDGSVSVQTILADAEGGYGTMGSKRDFALG